MRPKLSNPKYVLVPCLFATTPYRDATETECPGCGRLIEAAHIPLDQTPICYQCYAKRNDPQIDPLIKFVVLASISLFVMLCATLIHVFFVGGK